MEIKVKIVDTFKEESGTSKTGKEWRKRKILVEQQDAYKRNIIVDVWDKNIDSIPPKGTFANISIDIESREYNGRWYTDVKAWKIERVGIEVDNGNKPHKNDSDVLIDDFPPLPTEENCPPEKEEDDEKSGLPF